MEREREALGVWVKQVGNKAEREKEREMEGWTDIGLVKMYRNHLYFEKFVKLNMHEI